MFKNIQNRLLLTNPMLWNLKIVPFTVLALAIHVIFFALGYVNGAIDFTETDSNYTYNFNNEIVIFIGVLISILIFIVWLIVYSRNNGFKSFYPKKNNSLFKEWLVILLFCILNISYSASYLYAGDLKARSYFSEEEISRRCEVITMSSLFLEGSFDEPDFIMVPNLKASDTTELIRVERDSFNYNKKKYSLKSLINKNIDNFSVFSHYDDSIHKVKVKKWLVENRKDSVQWLFNEYFKISNEHNLKSNISPEKWLELVYHAPGFTNFANIGKVEREKRNDYDYGYYEGVDPESVVQAVAEPTVVDGEYVEAFDSISKIVKFIDGAEYVYSKYYVSHNALLRSYGKISNSWEHPDVNPEMLFSFFYFAMGLSLLIFTFKVTSGRNWLIALVSFGIVGIIIGILSILNLSGYTFSILATIVFVGLLVYFIIICKTKKNKGISGITLNQLIWMLPSICPIIYFTAFHYAKEVSGYNSRHYDSESNFRTQIEEFPKIEWLEAHTLHFIGLNILIVILLMYVFSVQIKKWKGIAEA